jgi:hypothetical protein
VVVVVVACVVCSVLTTDVNSNATMEEFDLASLRLEIFEFGCGGRMVGLWDDWGSLNDDDLSHVAAREDVRAHCIVWPMNNTEHFSSCVGTVVSLANGNQKAGFAKLKALSKKETSSEHAPVELSGTVDLRGLPLKSSSRCKWYNCCSCHCVAGSKPLRKTPLKCWWMW